MSLPSFIFQFKFAQIPRGDIFDIFHEVIFFTGFPTRVFIVNNNLCTLLSGFHHPQDLYKFNRAG